MKKSISISIILSFALLLTSFVATSQIDVISAKEAGKLLNADNTVFVSMRTPSDYQKVHITGAVNINHKDLYGDLSMLKPSGEVAKTLGDKGIGNDMNIILYDDGTGRYSGRMYWILDHLGAGNVRIIDGGMKGWRMARKPVTKNPTNVKPATFNVNVNKSILATMDDIKKAIGNDAVVIVDVRSIQEYDGKAETKLRKGHIPSAISFNFQNVLEDSGMMKNADAIAGLLDKNGITRDKEIILYCESSVRAGIVYTVLKGLDYPKVKVYDGAYLEWQATTSNKVAM